MIDYPKKFRLDGKKAFIIGGLGSIGKEVSIACATAGAKTIVIDKLAKDGNLFEHKMNQKDFDVSYKFIDCANMEQIETNFSALLNECGCPDIFINCSYPRTLDWESSTFKDITLESFRKNVDIHMNSVTWLARLAAEAMVKNKKSGSIIQLGSIYGVVGQDLTVYEGTDMNENMTYSAIKGGITNFTRLMASYYGQFKIRVNIICPGGISDENHKQVFVNQYSKKTPLKRLGKAEEIASTVLFLASEAASYITGAIIMVDGGWTSV